MSRPSSAWIAVLTGVLGVAIAVPLESVPWWFALPLGALAYAILRAVERHQAVTAPYIAPPALDDAAGDLTLAVKRRLEEPAGGPARLDVHWSGASPALVDPQPGMPPLAGELDDVLDTYLLVPSGRLV